MSRVCENGIMRGCDACLHVAGLPTPCYGGGGEGNDVADRMIILARYARRLSSPLSFFNKAPEG